MSEPHEHMLAVRQNARQLYSLAELDAAIARMAAVAALGRTSRRQSA